MTAGRSVERSLRIFLALQSGVLKVYPADCTEPKNEKSTVKNRAFCDVMPNRQIAAEGLEPPTLGLEITASAKRGGAKSGAQAMKSDLTNEDCDLLKQVIDAWDDLNPSAKALVAKMVEEFKGYVKVHALLSTIKHPEGKSLSRPPSEK